MPEHIRALIVVFALSAAVLFAVRPAITRVIPPDTYDRWRKLWLFTTLAWFLSGNVWIYFGLMVVVLTLARKRESHVFGLYLLLLFAAPSAHVAIPGFGVIDHLIMLDHYRLLSLTLLLPLAWRLKNDAETVRFGRSPVDWMVLGYLFLTWAVTLLGTSLTNGMRGAVLQFIDGWLPYYVASRSLKSTEDLRIAAAGLLMGVLVMSVLAAFEVMRSWKLYVASVADYGIRVNQAYKLRGPFIRPGASVQDSIVLGTSVVVGMCVLLSLRDRMAGWIRSRFLWAILALGLLASLSRAPWVAGVLLLLVFHALDGRGIKSIVKIGVVVLLAGGVLSFFPAGKVILDLLPFVGESEQGSIDYRMNWFAASAPVIERNFLFGDVHALGAPELEVMRNGEGIIDLVNTFLGVQLLYGAVGLFFFLGIFLMSLKIARQGQVYFRARSDEQASSFGRSMFAAMVSIMFILITMSPISVIPILIWSLAGFCSAYGFLAIRNRGTVYPATAVLRSTTG